MQGRAIDLARVRQPGPEGVCEGVMVSLRKPGLGESLQERFPAVAVEWHPNRIDDLTPADFKPGSSLKVWWLCSACGHEWQAAIQVRALGRGCIKCAARRRAAERVIVLATGDAACRITCLPSDTRTSTTATRPP
jgi:putative zinc ribbon protein